MLRLGNLQLNEVVNKNCLEKIQKFLDENGYRREEKCDSVKNKVGNYHIYDLPRIIVICGGNKTNEFIDFCKKENLLENGFNGQLGLTYCDLENKDLIS